jgi:subtilisin family serine protease
MDEKLLVTVRTAAEAEVVRQTGAEILATYPDSLLVRATVDQRDALGRAGLEAAPLGQPPIQVSGASFNVGMALAAEAAAPITHEPGRAAYFLIQLIGPARSDWLSELRSRGVTIHANLPGFAVLAGLLPDRAQQIASLPWVEAVTPYRATMKVSPKLRRGAARTLDVRDLMAFDVAADDAGGEEQVEISVFPGEGTTEIAARVRAEGGEVLAETPQEVIAVVSRGAIAVLAHEPAVQAILPYAMPHLSNDRSAPILGVPTDRLFDGLSLSGAGQIVAVADSGLDTGAPTTIHPDFRGRIVDIVRCPVKPGYLPYIDGPTLISEGPADVGSGHGTHVAGSVLGSGSAAMEHGDPTIPRGIAPEARVYFQAMEKGVRWKSAATLEAEGRRPFQTPWPPKRFDLFANPDDLNELFEPAYAAGARIHTNSWGGTKASALGSYNARARAVDAFLWTHRDMLILFAAGNSGVDADGGGQGNGIIDPDSITPPGTAKNCLTVGACEGDRPPGSSPPPGNDRRWTELKRADGTVRFPKLGPAGHVSDNVEGMAAFSSRGPTDDLRIKPDVVAPGTNILSARSSAYDNPDDPTILGGDLAARHPLHRLYCWSSGTSMATPLVAGVAALVRQYLVQERGHVLGGAKPSGALLKALIVNGAAHMPGQFAGEVPAGPGSVAGFGRVNVKATLGLDGAPPVFFTDEPDLAVETGQIKSIELEAVDLGQPLKATLVWTDAPGLPNQGGLQNVLYLQVRGPDGAVVDGDLTPYPNAVNNVQQVTIAQPLAGTYEVRVRGVSVTRPLPGTAPDEVLRQDFALAASNARAATAQPNVEHAVTPIGQPLGVIG